MSLADRIAGAIGARKSGGWWRTSTAHCHGGDNPDDLGFTSPDDDPEKLIVRCWTRHCHKTKEGRNRARDNLRAAAGLPPWQPTAPTGQRRRRRTGYKAPTGSSGPKTPENGAYGCPESRSKRKSDQKRGGDTVEWGAHTLPWDEGTGCHSHVSTCPQCGAHGLNVWTLTTHPFPYCGLALQCSCALPYDRLHKHIADGIAHNGKRWRQNAIYTLADGRARARVRTDPDKVLWWDTGSDGELRGAPVKFRRPLWWDTGRADPDRALIVEGEKAAAACVSAGIDGSHRVYSVGDAAGLYQSDYRGLTGRAVTLWADNDAVGRDGMLKAIPVLRRADVTGILIVEIKGYEEGTDAADHPVKEIRRAVHTAKTLRI